MPQSVPLSKRFLLPRVASRLLQEAMEDFPVVVVTGARQTGKTTLVRDLLSDPDRLYVSLDDLEALSQAETDPNGMVRRAPRMTIDEVQRAPDLLLAIKRAVDQRRVPGQFVLTGSANLLLMKSVSESLAGRAVYLTLGPLTRSELAGKEGTGCWDLFLDNPPGEWYGLVDGLSGSQEPWQALALEGGLPVPAVEMKSARARRRWFAGYVETYLERDLQDLSQVAHLTDYRRLLQATSLRVGNLLNQADLARDVGLPPTTAQRYLNLLETSYQVVKVPPYSVNRTKRLVKSPKIYWSDVGLALHLSGEGTPRGSHLENLVLNDILVWREAQHRAPQVLFWRTSKGAEVDFVLETDRGLLPIEVKSGERITAKDHRHLQVFLEEYSDSCRGGLLIHAGDETYWAAERVLAVPWWRVL